MNKEMTATPATRALAELAREPVPDIVAAAYGLEIASSTAATT